MKTRLIGLGLFMLTAATVILFPILKSSATTRVQPPPLNKGAEIEVVFVLDTTGSMGGLIATAKEKIWSIATTMAQANQAPRISMGLVAYRDRGDSYVTQVVDLSTDLDSMYASLMDFAADGGGDGPESVNQALHDAVHKVSWSQNPNSYQAIFLVGDAPPHMDYQDELKYPAIVAAARSKGIRVNAIQCGNVAQTTPIWTEIARLGDGRYLQVEQAGGAVAVATPFDADLATLSAALDETRVYYGSAEELAQSESKLAATDKLQELASVASRARRAIFNATASGAASLFGERELLEDVASGRVDVSDIPASELPEPLRVLPKEEQAAAIEAGLKRRAELQQRITELGAQRDDYLAGELDEQARDSLDVQLYEIVREQAAPKGLVYDAGPQF